MSRAKWILGSVALAALGGLVYQLGIRAQASGPAKAKASASATTTGGPAGANGAALAAKGKLPFSLPWMDLAAKVPADAEADEEEGHEKLQPGTWPFFQRIDEGIPSQLYSQASLCYSGGQKKDAKLKVEYSYEVRKGIVKITNAKILSGTVDDQMLKDCVLESIATAEWPDDQLPDTEGSDEVLVRVRGMKKHWGDEQEKFPEGPSTVMGEGVPPTSGPLAPIGTTSADREREQQAALSAAAKTAGENAALPGPALAAPGEEPIAPPTAKP